MPNVTVNADRFEADVVRDREVVAAMAGAAPKPALVRTLDLDAHAAPAGSR